MYTDGWPPGPQLCPGDCGDEKIRLKVVFQPRIVISPTSRWNQWCVQVYAGVDVVTQFGPVLFGPNASLERNELPRQLY